MLMKILRNRLAIISLIIVVLFLSGCSAVREIVTDYLKEEIQDNVFPLWNEKYAIVSLVVSTFLHMLSASKDPFETERWLLGKEPSSAERGKRGGASILALVILVGTAKAFVDSRFALNPIAAWAVSFFAGLLLSLPIMLVAVLLNGMISFVKYAIKESQS